MPDEQTLRKIEVKTSGGNHLFTYEGHCLEIHRRGQVFRIPIADLVDFSRTSQKTIYRVNPILPRVYEPDEEIVRQEFE